MILYSFSLLPVLSYETGSEIHVGIDMLFQFKPLVQGVSGYEAITGSTESVDTSSA